MPAAFFISKYLSDRRFAAVHEAVHDALNGSSWVTRLSASAGFTIITSGFEFFGTHKGSVKRQKLFDVVNRRFTADEGFF